LTLALGSSKISGPNIEINMRRFTSWRKVIEGVKTLSDTLMKLNNKIIGEEQGMDTHPLIIQALICKAVKEKQRRERRVGNVRHNHSFACLPISKE
jgi:hypothetical protein